MKNSSVKSSLHSVEYRTPALARLPLRFSMPTRPGHWPLQLATVRMGPVWLIRPGRMCWEYCQTASATISGALELTDRNTSSPRFWLSMNPCCLAASNSWARPTEPPRVLDRGGSAAPPCCAGLASTSGSPRA